MDREYRLEGALGMPMELHEVDRKEIFFRIVHLQDKGVELDDCRNRIVSQFGIDVEKVREIESEGLTKQWPPL